MSEERLAPVEVLMNRTWIQFLNRSRWNLFISEWLECFWGRGILCAPWSNSSGTTVWIGKRPGELKLFSVLPGDLLGIPSMLRWVARGWLISPVRWQVHSSIFQHGPCAILTTRACLCMYHFTLGIYLSSFSPTVWAHYFSPNCELVFNFILCFPFCSGSV